MNSLDKLAITWGSRLPMIMQTEAAECGVACLAMIVGYHGQPCGITELRRRLSVSLKGTSLKHLVGMAERLGFAARPLRLELDELRQLSTPCILHWDLHHFVVLAKVTRDGIVIHDPAVGVRRLPMAAVSRHFTGVALELTPVGELAPAQESPRVRLRSILGRVVGLRRSLGQLLALAVAIEVFAITGPLFMQWVVDHALVSADRDLLLVLALGFGMLLLLRTMVSAMRGWIVIVLGASLKVQGRANVFSHMINLPSSYFEARHLGDVVQRFCSQDVILQTITTDVVEALLDGLLVGVTLAIMFLFAPTLTLVAIAGALVYGLLRWVSYSPLRHASAEAIVWGARRDSHVLETLRGVKTIKLFNGQDSRRAHWMNLLIEATNRQLTTQKLQLLVRTANVLLIGTLAIVVVWMGANMVLEKQMSIGMLLAFIAYKDQFLGRVGNLIDRAVDLTMLRLHAERLADIALTKPEPRGAAADASETARPVAIEARNLRFRYSEGDPWVLNRVSFRIEPGETVAIVGASGCGKTTLLKILASLLPPTEGELLVDGQSLGYLGATRWRSMIGVVMQDDQLFAGSVADNICFFADQPELRRIEECARLAALHDEIAAMPMGYHTLIGDMGTVLSGGQKQRLLIARALYRQPGVLLLDEATSDLDVANEKLVNAAIRATQVTRVIVAHRPETIRSADRVINLDELGGHAAAHVVGLPGAGRPAIGHAGPAAQSGSA
jgi:ATP-binding cassette subfamily B protein RaxB